MHLLQLALPDTSLTEYVLRGMGALLVAAVGWLAREVAAMRKTLDRWDVELFGISGDNGLRGNVRTLMSEREERMMGRRQQVRRLEDQ